MVGAVNRSLPVDAFPLFKEGIRLVLFHWPPLQSALKKEVELLCSDIFTWFSHNGPLYIDDLESLLDKALRCLHIVTDDFSVPTVAEKLIVMHEKCLEGDFRCIESLKAIPSTMSCSSACWPGLKDFERKSWVISPNMRPN